MTFLGIIAWLPLVVPASVLLHEFSHWLVAKAFGCDPITVTINFATPWKLVATGYGWDDGQLSRWQHRTIALAPKVLDLVVAVSARLLWQRLAEPYRSLAMCIGVFALIDFVCSFRDWREAWNA